MVVSIKSYFRLVYRVFNCCSNERKINKFICDLQRYVFKWMIMINMKFRITVCRRLTHTYTIRCSNWWHWHATNCQNRHHICRVYDPNACVFVQQPRVREVIDKIEKNKNGFPFISVYYQRVDSTILKRKKANKTHNEFRFVLPRIFFFSLLLWIYSKFIFHIDNNNCNNNDSN